MNDVLIVTALFLVLLGAVSFYFYSRMLFSERKMGLIESILLDIKMNMEMEEERNANAHTHAVPPSEKPVVNPAAMGGQVEAEELEAEYYNSVIETAVTEPVISEVIHEAETVVEAATLSAATLVNYEADSREELMALAEKRGLRVTKRMAKPTVIAVLREADKSSPVQADGSSIPGAAGVIPSMEGSSGGAPLVPESGEVTV
jgi:hypothetical protein